MIVEATVRKAFRVYLMVAGYHVLNSSPFCSLYPCRTLCVSEANQKACNAVYHLGCTGHHSKKWMWETGPPLGSSEAGKAFRLQPWREAGR